MGIAIRMGLTCQRAGGGASPLDAALAWVNAGADGALIGPTSPRWQDSARTTSWTADGDPVGYVADLSRFASDLSQATAGNRLVGFTGYMLNNGTTGFMTGPSKTPKAGCYLAGSFMVPAFGGVAGTRALWHMGPFNGADRLGLQVRADDAGTRTLLASLRLSSGTIYQVTTTLAFAFGTGFVAEVWADGTGLFLAVNGGTPDTVAAPIGSAVGAAAALNLASSQTVSTRFGAVILRDGLPTGSDRSNIIVPFLQSVLP